MQTFELTPQPIDPSLAPGTELWNQPAPEKTAPGQFESVMGRTLGSRRDQDDTADDSGKLRVQKNKPRPKSKIESPQTVSVMDSPIQPPAPRPASAPSQPDAAVPGVPGAPAAGAGDVEKMPAAASEDADDLKTAAVLSQPAVSGNLIAPGILPDPTRALEKGSTTPIPTAGDMEGPATGSPMNGLTGSAQKGQAASAEAGASLGKFSFPGMAPDPGLKSTGISSAQQVMAMQKAETMNLSSGSTEQDLPVLPAGFAGAELPAKILHSSSSVASRDSSTPGATFDSFAVPGASSTESATATAPAAQVAADSSVRSLDRLHDMVAVQASRLRDSGADSLQVVIKPGSGTQLSLNLQMRDGTVEVQATLHRGDYDFLNRHWGELQQQLESRGVRVSELVSNNPSAGGDANSFQAPGRQKEQPETATSGGLAEVAVKSSTTPRPVRSLKTAQGWESWA